MAGRSRLTRRQFIGNSTATVGSLAIAGAMPRVGWAAATGAANAAAGAARGAHDLPSQAPIAYIRDYSPGHPGDAAFIEAIATNAPDLLVLGKDMPLHHNWGPVAGTGGENQAFGQGEHIRRLSPDEFRDKTESIRRMVADLRATGVRWIMPYICTMTLGGRHDLRSGFWEFYDAWDEYRDAFGLGPRPADDPIDWMQRQPDGEIHTYYEWKAPYYAPNHRWAACINHPGWRQHLGNVVRLAAEAGYDGVYMDNFGSTLCHCRHCQAGFRAWMGADAPPDLRLSDEPGTRLFRQSHDFRAESRIQFLHELQAIGRRARGGEFLMFPNPGAWFKGAPLLARLGEAAAFMQSEENGEATGAHPGLVVEPILGPLEYRTWNRRVVEYKFAQSLRSGLRVTMTTTRNLHAGTPQAGRAVDMNPWTVALAIAESAAYGGGGAKNISLKHDTRGEIARWRAFFRDEADLYTGAEIRAPAAVLAFGEQAYFNDSIDHQTSIMTVSLHLAERLVLFDMIHEPQLSPERLRRHGVVIVPDGLEYISDAHLEVLRDYAREGGRLIVLGDRLGRFDELSHERAADAREIGDALRPGAAPTAAALLAAVESALGPAAVAAVGPDGHPPEGVGVNAWARPSAAAPDELIVHLVNYNTPLGIDSETPPIEIGELDVRVPLPPGARVAGVSAHSPWPGENLSTEIASPAGTARIRLRGLSLYKVLRIRLAGAGPAGTERSATP